MSQTSGQTSVGYRSPMNKRSSRISLKFVWSPNISNRWAERFMTTPNNMYRQFAAKTLQKPEEYIMVIHTHKPTLIFKGSFEPAFSLQIVSAQYLTWSSFLPSLFLRSLQKLFPSFAPVSWITQNDYLQNDIGQSRQPEPRVEWRIQQGVLCAPRRKTRCERW